MLEADEIWRSLPFPGYEVSNLGRIRSWRSGHWGHRRQRREPLIRKLVPNQRGGYLTVTFFVEGAYICRYVHNLVLGAFKGQRPSGLEGRHLDGNVLNNRADNLEWATHVENEADKIQHGTDSRGERNGMAKLSNAEAQIIRESGESGVSLARKYGVSQTAVSRIRKGVRYARG